MKIYISYFGEYHIDYEEARQFLSNIHGVEQSGILEEADIYFVLSGMYLTYGYKAKMEKQLQEAVSLGKTIYTAAPHGTNYIPLGLRAYSQKHMNLEQHAFTSALAGDGCSK